MKKNYLMYIFFGLIATLYIFDLINSDKSFSELENRNLKSRVKFSVKSFSDNSFQKDYEEYINDQFVLRDQWISLKSRCEFALGKIENNGIIYGEDNYLFDKFNKIDETRVKNNIIAFNTFKSRVQSPISIMIVPNSYEVYKELLPVGAPVIDQKSGITNIYKQFKDIDTIDMLDTMEQNKEQYIYYRNDHHWTTYGAYLGYREFIDSIGLEPIELEDYKSQDVDNFLGTYFSKSKPFNAKADILTYYDIDNVTMTIYGEEYNTLYDYSKLESVDKYSVFIKGNNALTIIKNNDLKNDKKLLVIKDSFANSMVPFLTQNFEEVHVVDLRNFNEKLEEYAKEIGFDNILVLYSFGNFVNDAQIIRLKY